MSKNPQRAWFDLHSITGVILGLAMFVVCFSGVLSLFAHYLPAWEHGALRAAATDRPFDPDRALAQLAVAAPDAWARLPVAEIRPDRGEEQASSPFFIFAPTASLPFVHVRWFDLETRRGYDYYVDPESGSVVETPPLGLSHTLVEFHTDLMLPSPFGRYLVGILGVGFLFVILSGIFFHRKMLRQMFVFRRGRSWRVLWADSHKMFGVWGLLFHLMITFTGAFLGLIGIFLLVSALTVYRGDQDAALAAVLPPAAEVSGEAADMLPFGELLDRATAAWPELEPNMISLHAFHDRNAEVTIAGPVRGNLVGGGPTGTEITLSAVTGEVVRRTDWPDGSLPQRLVAWVAPLHYATFGGLLLKLAYTLLGLSSALMSVTGLLIWLERRAAAESTHRFAWLERLTIGVCAGMPAAVAATFAATAVLPTDHADQAAWLHAVFLGSWLLAILFALRPAERRTTTGWLSIATGVLCVTAAGGGSILHHAAGTAAWQTGSWSAGGVDLALLLVGGLALQAGRRCLRTESISPRVANASMPEAEPHRPLEA